MASQNGGYGHVQQNYGSAPDMLAAGYTAGSTGTYGVSVQYGVSQQYPPSAESSYGGGYGYPQQQYSSATTYQQPAGAYAAVAEPVAQTGSASGQRGQSQGKFSSPPSQFNSTTSQFNSPPAPPVKQEQSWQGYGTNSYGTNSYGTSSYGTTGSSYGTTGSSYGTTGSSYGSSYGNSYGDNSVQYGTYGDKSGYTGTQDNNSGYSNSDYSKDYSQRSRGYQSRGGRGSRDGRGTFRGRRGGSDTYRGRGVGRATTYDSGDGFSKGGSSWRGAQGGGRGRGRGQYEGQRGRGRGQDGVRGRGRGRGGQDGVRGRGRGSDQGYNSNWKSNYKGGNTSQQASCKVALEGDQHFISYKNSLQEFCQKSHKPVPQYTLSKVEVGYSATVVVDGVTYSGQTSQREKKFAELAAAFEALKGLGFINTSATFTAKGKKRSLSSGELAPPKTKAAKSESNADLNMYPVVSYKSKLNEVCQKMKIDSPSYSSERAAGGFICTLLLNGQVYQSSKPCGTKKLSEQDAAQVTLSLIDYTEAAKTTEEPIIDTQRTPERALGVDYFSRKRSSKTAENAVITPIISTPSTSASNTITTPSALEALTTDTPSFTGGLGKTPAVPKSMKNHLQEYCQKNGMDIPCYVTVQGSGMQISTVTVNNADYVGTPHIMKKTAEQNAAKKAIEELGVK